MAFPTTDVLDTLGGTLGNWTTPVYGDNAVAISSGQLASSSGYGGGVWTSSFGADQECFYTVPVLPAAAGVIWIHCRTTDNTGPNVTSYHIRYVPDTGAWALRKWVAGSSTVLLSGTQVLSAGDAIGISAVGTTITAYRKPSGGSWGELGSASDSSISSGGQIGLELSDTTARVDDFGGGNYVAETPAGDLMVPMGMIGLGRV